MLGDSFCKFPALCSDEIPSFESSSLRNAMVGCFLHGGYLEGVDEVAALQSLRPPEDPPRLKPQLLHRLKACAVLDRG